MELLPGILRALAALAFTLGLLLTAAWAWRRWGGTPSFGGPANPRLKVVEKLSLSTTTTLYLVSDGTTEHLIAAGTHAPQVIRSTPVKHKAKP